VSLSVLYRGPLSSCNYDCSYCPFAKHVSSSDELVEDKASLERFVAWASATDRELSILFTPWGEGLVRRWYREAMVALSHRPNVSRVAIQTNLSGSTSWMAEADLATFALWVTYHPSQADYADFLARLRDLDALGVRYSVGIVGLRENMAAAEALRRDLPDDVYLWINAYKSDGPGYYAPGEVERLTALDPRFPDNNVRHPSRGEACQAGLSAITVDGAGDVRRCHFVDGVLGNLYARPLDEMLAARPCPNETCGCHIGYVHMDRLGLYPVYGEGLMERIPTRLPVVP
jgi:MoaA/NifB/PqqE/SkfB family radical SAM enzyme